MAPDDLIHAGATRDCTVRGVKMITLRQHEDSRGPICVLGQASAALPFLPQRLFLTHSGTGGGRGQHAHRECAQILLCTAGSLRVLVDDGTHSEEIILSRPQEALYIPPMVWAEQYDHSPEAVLLVLASHPYDPGDYLRTRDAWLAALRPGP